MGTLFNQTSRRGYFDNYAVKILDKVKALAEEHMYKKMHTP